MPEISVILPTYNPDIPKLERAIKSILCQTYCDFELIIVDDGSEYDKQNEIDKLVAKDNRIRLLQQEHKGVAAARNNGIANAKGTYIAFVDDDDLVSPFYLEESRKVIIEMNCDFILGGVIRQKGDTFPQGVIEKKDYTIEILEDENVREFEYYGILGHVKRLSDKGYVNRGPAAKLIRKDSCNIHFPENIVHGEDLICNLDILNQVKRIAIVDRIWYLYIINNTSATNKCASECISQAELLIKEVLLRTELDSPERIKEKGDYIDFNLRQILGRWFYHPDCPLTKHERRKALRSLAKKDPWKFICKRKYWMQTSRERKKRLILFSMGLLPMYGLQKKVKRAVLSILRKIKHAIIG